MLLYAIVKIAFVTAKIIASLGMYSYDDIHNYIQEILERNDDDKEGIKLSFILSS